MSGWEHEHFVDVDPSRLRVLQAGPPGTHPPLLLLGGLGSLASDWDGVLGHLAPNIRLIWIEEVAGDGQSARTRGTGQTVRDGDPSAATPVRQRVEAIRTAAQALRLSPPYLVAGHSLGGLYAQGFARLAPNLTAGVGLIDSTIPAAHLRSALGAACFAVARRFFGDARRAAAVAPTLRRLVVWCNTVHGRDPLSRASARRIYGDPAVALTILDEWARSSSAEAELCRIATSHGFPDVPLIVLAGARFGRPWTRRDTDWLRDQRLLAGLAPRGRFVQVDDAAHLVMLDRPDAVATALVELLTPVA